MELCSSTPFLKAELDEVRTGETGLQQQYNFWNSRQPLRNKMPNLFRFNFCSNIFCPIPPCVAEAVELVWTCQTGPAQCSHSSAWVLNYQQLTLHCCYITIKCKILLVPAKDQLSVQFLGDLHLQVVILPLTRFEKKTIQQQLLLLLLHVLHHRPSRALKDGREKAGHPQSHLAQELARSQRKVCNSFAKKRSHWLLGRRYGYGGWVSLDHTCGGSPKPGKANMMKVRPHIILTLFFIIIINMIIF